MMTSLGCITPCVPMSDHFVLATVRKERLLGDFSRKISSPITLSRKFSIPRTYRQKLLDSEKFLEKSFRFREDNIYKYRVLWLCQAVAEPRELWKQKNSRAEVSIRREEEDAMSSLLALRHKLLFRAKVILMTREQGNDDIFRMTQHCIAQRHVSLDPLSRPNLTWLEHSRKEAE